MLFHLLVQCAICKANVVNAENASVAARDLNTAILALLLPTLAIIGSLVRLVYQYRHTSHEPDHQLNHSSGCEFDPESEDHRSQRHPNKNRQT